MPFQSKFYRMWCPVRGTISGVRCNVSSVMAPVSLLDDVCSGNRSVWRATLQYDTRTLKAKTVSYLSLLETSCTAHSNFLMLSSRRSVIIDMGTLVSLLSVACDARSLSNLSTPFINMVLAIKMDGSSMKEGCMDSVLIHLAICFMSWMQFFTPGTAP